MRIRGFFKKSVLFTLMIVLAVFISGCSDSGGGSKKNIVIKNTTSFTVTEINISPVSSDYWGTNVLGSGSLAAGKTYATYRTPGLYDFRIIYSDGDKSELPSRSISDTTVYTLTLVD